VSTRDEHTTGLRDLIAAVRDALTVPAPAALYASHRDEILADRAAQVRVLLTHTGDVELLVRLIREIPGETPATYPTREQGGAGR
jgi:hypothetical protein